MASERKITQADIAAKVGDRIEVSVTRIPFGEAVWCHCLASDQRDKALVWNKASTVMPSDRAMALTFYEPSDFFRVPSEDLWRVVVRTMPDQIVKIKLHTQ